LRYRSTTRIATKSRMYFAPHRIYGIGAPPPACRIFAPKLPVPPPILTIGIHISARKPSQRWPADHFADTIKAIAAQGPVRFLLLWSPGTNENPLHPGDDAKARNVVERIGAVAAVTPRPTETLAELIAALAECDMLVCADGGAMHLGAGLGLPIVCLFGNSGQTLAAVGSSLPAAAETFRRCGGYRRR
jgi:ADP-heptose:LPS heptosyltransferase